MSLQAQIEINHALRPTVLAEIEMLASQKALLRAESRGTPQISKNTCNTHITHPYSTASGIFTMGLHPSKLGARSPSTYFPLGHLDPPKRHSIPFRAG